MRARAEGGDGQAMYELGTLHLTGEYGIDTDDVKAYGWFKRGADLKNVSCLHAAGSRMFYGFGVDLNVPYGLMLMTQAAERGSAAGALQLAHLYEEGIVLPKDPALAQEMYEKVANATVNDVSDERKVWAASRAARVGAGLA